MLYLSLEVQAAFLDAEIIIIYCISSRFWGSKWAGSHRGKAAEVLHMGAAVAEV